MTDSTGYGINVNPGSAGLETAHNAGNAGHSRAPADDGLVVPVANTTHSCELPAARVEPTLVGAPDGTSNTPADEALAACRRVVMTLQSLSERSEQWEGMLTREGVPVNEALLALERAAARVEGSRTEPELSEDFIRAVAQELYGAPFGNGAEAADVLAFAERVLRRALRVLDIPVPAVGAAGEATDG